MALTKLCIAIEKPQLEIAVIGIESRDGVTILKRLHKIVDDTLRSITLPRRIGPIPK